MDITLDREALQNASRQLNEQATQMTSLVRNLEASFSQLRRDWDSDAGRKFFSKFENELLRHMRDHCAVLTHMSGNLRGAATRYEEVFRAADAVVNSQI